MARNYGRSNYKKPEASPTPTRVEKVWSNYQNAIFDEIQNGDRHIMVNAKPGSSKTTTCVESMWRLPESVRGNTLSLAFSKDIQRELDARCPTGVVSKTFHSLGLGVLTKKMGRIQVDTRGDKLDKIVTNLIGDKKEEEELHEAVIKTIKACKANLYETEEEIESAIDQYDLDIGRRQEQIDAVSKALQSCVSQPRVADYDDMLWLPYKLDLSFPKYHLGYVDEAQDCSKLRINLLRRCLGPNSRAVVVGDKGQAIFAFAFADENSMDNLKAELNPVVLPLSVSYRCAQSIVREAQKLVPDIEWSPTAPEGSVSVANQDKMLREAIPGDAILSRINAPLISIALKFIKDGRRANILGRDIGKTLGWMVKRSKKDTVPEFLSWLSKWKDDEVERVTKKKGDPEPTIDRASCLETLCEGSDSLSDVLSKIDNLFNDVSDNTRITISSAHRSKGKEWNRVWLLENFRKTQDQSEINLRYVAITRSKTDLFYVR